MATDSDDPGEADAATLSSGATDPAAVRAEGFDERYERRTLLGVGGRGEVLLCKDHHIGREVALEVLRDKAADRGSALRFLREARLRGQLEHPAIVPVYDLGVDPRGDTFFTMKRIRGMTLDAVLRGKVHGDAWGAPPTS